MSRRRALGLLFGVLVAGAVLGLVAFQILYPDALRNARIARTDCDDLPRVAEVRRTLETHRELVWTLEHLSENGPSHVQVFYREVECPSGDRAVIVIYYDTIGTRRAIGRLLGPTFEGLPYQTFHI